MGGWDENKVGGLRIRLIFQWIRPNLLKINNGIYILSILINEEIYLNNSVEVNKTNE